MKCKRRMANSTGSVSELWLSWANSGGETFGEGTADAGKEGGLIDEGIVDGFEEEFEDFEDACAGDGLAWVESGRGVW